MTATRRQFLRWGGGVLAVPILPMAPSRGASVVEVVMTGREDGSAVWFDPVGLAIEVGQTVRWTNKDPANAHTATAYHPDNEEHPQRVPQDARSWDSGYLLPGESALVSFGVSGVYDYFCIPHEMAGMVGRIVVGDASSSEWMSDPGSDDGVPRAALDAFPSIADILSKGVVRHDDGLACL